ncbi:2,3,4,5-tetrahydropyridine-2,6-dicarboxylate N-succinyltransferase [Buchnera aphidicola (Taiwanaphis decaspermi)]|uniref:2,3,4,5-tetrahydropyridine-2,6-dicarboxylate N-succinyltransferase n=1 Tax=Buchnera aphidicola TaxID=9 RepID=UPI0031B87B0E
MKNIKNKIKNIFNKQSFHKKKNIDKNEKKDIEKVISMLNDGKIRVSEKINNKWVTHQWIKKAILLYLNYKKNKIFSTNTNNYYDKVPLKFSNFCEEDFSKKNYRIVPHATVRYGSFIEENCVLMPSYVNIGAYISKNSMIDTWATIGSCAQIGKNVHISGGVGIGGVLEPLQNNPTIIEDNCFIGARSEIVEGVIVKKGSVISMGVYIGQSTKIYNRKTEEINYGIIPENSVVVPGTLPSNNGKYNLYAAIIVKKVDKKTLEKVKINKILRNIK